MSKVSKTPMDNGFSLIELLIVITILAILGISATVTYVGSIANSRDARRRADIDAMVKAYEVNYSQTSGYQPLQGEQFRGHVIPQDPRDIDYYNFRATNGSSFKVCAALEISLQYLCNTTSPTCYCKESSQNSGS